MSTPDKAAEQRAEMQTEWGTYVATETILVGSARAFNVGDPVPVSHVKNGVVDASQVAKTSTKAAAAATEKG